MKMTYMPELSTTIVAPGSDVLAWLGPKALALAWPEAALAC